jgi:single-stranded DNA-binding protein
MSTLCLISGVLYRAPEQRTSKAGRAFVTATIKARDGDAAQFWRVTAFSETAQTELLRLGDGDSVSVQGAMRAEIFRPDGGEPRISLSLVADSVLALRQPAKTRQPKVETGTFRRSHNVPLAASHGGTGDAAAGLDDAIPF